MNLWFVLGTAAELIKMYPVIREAESRKISWYAISSGQSPQNLIKQWEDLRLDKNKIFSVVDNNQDLKKPSKALIWFFKSILTSHKKIRKIINQKTDRYLMSEDIFFVHGDTLTTLVGALWAKKLNVSLAHVEAGMRSGHLLEPFPEEISRRLVSRLTDWHFPPYEKALDNLKKEKQSGKMISTGANTLLDAIRTVLTEFAAPLQSMNGKVLVNLHRFENLNNPLRWNKMISVVQAVAKKHAVVFVMHPPTKNRLERDLKNFEALKKLGVEFKDRVPFTQFAHWLDTCDFIITDGGSNQQETSYLGKPCLLLRERTESVEGLGSNCILSRFNDRIIQEFLDQPQKYQTKSSLDLFHPSQIILNTITGKNETTQV